MRNRRRMPAVDRRQPPRMMAFLDIALHDGDMRAAAAACLLDAAAAASGQLNSSLFRR